MLRQCCGWLHGLILGESEKFECTRTNERAQQARGSKFIFFSHLHLESQPWISNSLLAPCFLFFAFLPGLPPPLPPLPTSKTLRTLSITLQLALHQVHKRSSGSSRPRLASRRPMGPNGHLRGAPYLFRESTRPLGCSKKRWEDRAK